MALSLQRLITFIRFSPVGSYRFYFLSLSTWSPICQTHVLLSLPLLYYAASFPLSVFPLTTALLLVVGLLLQLVKYRTTIGGCI
jgi:hypothetical protein